MNILSAFRDGTRRVNSAPLVLLGVLALTFLLALPLGLTLRGMLGEHLGRSLAADTAASGVNYEWWEEFEAQATGVGTSFSPKIIGFAAVLDNVSSILDNFTHSTVIIGAGVAYIAFWIFLVGGILDRFARNRPTRTAAFFSACGVYFFRFLRLAVMAWIAYAVVLGVIHSWLFDRFYPWATHDWTVERNAFALRIVLYAAFGALLVGVNVLFDYAKIRAVVEDRRSMIGAVMGAWRFIRRHLAQAIGLYLLNALAFVVVLALYALVAPGAGSGGPSMWAGLVVTELYLALRLWVKLVFYASQTAFFQGALAHAEYTASPVIEWPESPAAEAIPRQ